MSSLKKNYSTETSRAKPMEAASSSLNFVSPLTGTKFGKGPEFLKFCEVLLKNKHVPSSLCLATGNSGAGFRDAVHGVADTDGIIIVDHGSRRGESNLMLNDFVVMFRGKTKYAIVEPAHMELVEPSIKDAFASCIQQGAKRVIVSSFFLFPGRHLHQDIPSLTAEATKEHPGVSYLITAPLGLHELLLDVLNDRIKYYLSHAAGDKEECSVCAGIGKLAHPNF